ncbi:MAG: ribosome small subunit-dependent GTPase A, partial [Luminiphilus sp.]
MTKPRLTDQQARRIKAQRAQQGSADDHNGETGTVVARYGKQALVEAPGGDRVLCHLRSHLESPVAGDRVVWARSEEAGVITALTERQNVLHRPDIKGQLRPVAANIQLLLVVFAPEPAPQANLLDRYLVAAEHIGVEAALVLNKADLLKDAVWPEQLEHYAALGYRTLITHHGMSDASDLAGLIGTNTVVLVGQSGVGKSSLIQRMLPDESIRVGALSALADKGRHTTTTAELFHLPNGGRLIDSPGVREFGLTHITAADNAIPYREVTASQGRSRLL